jgi:hypothetical protein
VGLFNAPLRDLVGLIDARIEQLQEGGDTTEAAAEPAAADPEEAPAEEAPAAEAPAEEPAAGAAEEDAAEAPAAEAEAPDTTDTTDENIQEEE